MESNIFPYELLRDDNYVAWSDKMESNLSAQGLWDIVKIGSETPELDDDVVEFEAWRKMNDAALHAIQSSCGMDILSRINKISSAKIAWEKLAQMFKDQYLQVFDPTVEQGDHSYSSNISVSGQDMPTGTGANQLEIVGPSCRKLRSMQGADPIGRLKLKSMGTGPLTTAPIKLTMGADPRTPATSCYAVPPTLVMHIDNGQDKPIQREDDDSITTDVGNASISNNSVVSSTVRQEREDADCAALFKAVWKGDWNATSHFLDLHPRALTAKFIMDRTVLHHAVDAEQEHIVQELVNMISEQDLLKMQDSSGFTALHETCFSGNSRMAECLIRKNKKLVSIRNYQNELPIDLAMGCGHTELAAYLYSQTPFKELEAKNFKYLEPEQKSKDQEPEQKATDQEPEQMYYQGASLLNRCIYTGDLGMALALMGRCPRLALALEYRRDISPLEALAVSTIDAFEGGKGMVFWKQWIYKHCIPDISCACATDQVSLNIQNGQEKRMGAVRERLPVASLSELLGFKHLYDMKLVQAQFQELLSRMCQAIPANKSPRNNNILCKIIIPAIFHSIRRGNFEFVYQIVKENPVLLLIGDTEGRSIFHWAILNRQDKIFSLIYSLKKKNAILNMVDKSRNTILHMAGKLTENTPIDQIRGAALQMQREVQWFKEVEGICPLSCKEFLNKDNLTPGQLFSKDHQELRKEGERWMKDTATSCSVVGALIITIMFTAAFTIPGGNNQDTGLPILMHDKLFILFIVTDSVSLFSSSTSVLMFLGILTSRYAEEDFLKSLPRKMIIGLFVLFFSIATMMIAFSAALLLMLPGKYWIVVPIIGLAGVPIILFVLMQFHLLIDMLGSTYGSGIFDRKMKPWL